jgi:hypothetical protein
MKQKFEVWLTKDGRVILVQSDSELANAVREQTENWTPKGTVELDITEPAKFKKGDRLRKTKEAVKKWGRLFLPDNLEIVTVSEIKDGEINFVEGNAWAVVCQDDLELAPKTVKKMQYAYGLIGSKQVSGITNIRTEGENIKAVYWYSPIPETEVEE